MSQSYLYKKRTICSSYKAVAGLTDGFFLSSEGYSSGKRLRQRGQSNTLLIERKMFFLKGKYGFLLKNYSQANI